MYWNTFKNKFSTANFLGRRIMGEKIKDIGCLQLGKSNITVELNHSTQSGEKYEIHLQNDKFRLALPEKDFLQMASAVLLAKKQLDIIKRKCDQ